jgi:hypothetical protein
MKIINYCLLFTALLLGVSIHAQTAEEIVAKHIEAIGGKQKLSSINSVTIDNSIDVGGNIAPAKLIILNGKGYRSDADFDGQKVISVYTDKSGWAQNPFVGASEPTPMTDAQYKVGADQIYIVPLLDYASRGDKIELVGREKVGNIDAYKLKLTNKAGNITHYLIDPSTYYIVQTINNADFGGQMIDLKITSSDFKKTDYGWVVPYTNTTDFGGQFSMVSTVNKVELNGTVDTTLFDLKK